MTSRLGAIAGRLVSVAVIVAASACADDEPRSSADLFAPEVRRIVLEIDYQPGAEPNLEPRMLPTGEMLPPLSMTATNLGRLFEREGPLFVTVPQTLSEMQALDDVTADRFSDEDILAIARAHQDSADDTGQRTLYAVFLNGYYVHRGEVRDDVLGVTPSDDLRVVALFKPAIVSVEAAAFAEQSTLVHELGHAIGLVNDGIPATSDHHDAEHGAHCTNDRCVMFHLNEGISDLQQFVSRFLLTGTPTLFGVECMQDVRAMSE